jgi:hypothetical protein
MPFHYLFWRHVLAVNIFEEMARRGSNESHFQDMPSLKSKDQWSCILQIVVSSLQVMCLMKIHLNLFVFCL